MSNMKPTRVQKICTLWTHDDNFSRDDVVFNGDKFPELPITPGTLLQIVSIESGTSVRDFQASAQAHAPQDRGASSARDADGQLKRSRRGSMTLTVDENGTAIPGGRETDVDKAYVFAVTALPADLKSKHANLHVSISERIAKVFGFRNRMQVIVAEVRPCSSHLPLSS
jgi:hypothetical protein